MPRYFSILLFLIAFVFINQNKIIAQQSKTLFQLLPSSQTGIAFNNQLTESDSLNILNQANIYNGGGIGIGDFNGDGLMDIYFAGNMVPNKLYLNRGNMKFEDVTNIANVAGDGRWCTGISVVDINADGLPDIYVSCSFRKDKNQRTNLLYINQGKNKDGIPTFKESAAAYGLADTGFSTQAYFFDYDKDGDLDMYQVTNELYDPKTPIKFRAKVRDGSAKNTDRLYRNNGDGTFTNVSKEAGITTEGWGHAACITDINGDGWPDIYVANDFVSNDLCLINNRDGTFTDKLAEYFRHTAWNAMGTDAVDINNDGLVDFVSLEMLPEDNLRKKRMLSGNEYYNYTNAAKWGYTHQYVRNMLQLNSGMTPLGHPIFNDIGYMAGVYQTDWSWCPLVADFDNDGLRDMIVSNGLPRDVTDLDYMEYGNGLGGRNTMATTYNLAMTEPLPVVKLADYAFKNNNGLTFTNVSKEWGFTQPNFSNGAVYVDLDNDGDLDVVINSINDTAFVYENTLNDDKKDHHYLTTIIKGAGKNTAGFGARLWAYFDGGKLLYYEHQPCRGYLSTDDPRAHFGLGKATEIDSLKVTWPDGKQQILTNIEADEQITISYEDAKEIKPVVPKIDSSVFINANNKYNIHFKPKERDFVDYDIQPSMPHKLSQYGPGIAVGDIDGNGFDDFYVGGTSGNRGVFFMQNSAGKFTLDSTRFIQKDDELYEDMGAILFDADGDGDL
ncbi:MAG: CRTAC1 family protein, partial [Bacteroidota bacterium]|nr:CRTAC1 family protein [Bacteroidota bacterium]